MRKIKVNVTESTQKNRVGVQETLIHLPNSGGGEGGHGGGDKPRPPRKSLEERIVNVLKVTVPSMITVALKPVVNKLDSIDNRLSNVEKRLGVVEKRLDNVDQRLNKQDEFNQYIKRVFKQNKLS